MPSHNLNAFSEIPQAQQSHTAHDTNTLPRATVGVWVGTGGNMNCQMWGDSSAVVRKNIPAGTYIPGNWKLILSTSTTAADFVVDYIPRR